MRKVVTLKTALSYALALSLASGTALAAEASRAPAGTIDGAAIETLTLTNGQGVTAKILTYGATLQSLMAPGKDGQSMDVLLGYDDAKDYADHPNYFGVTVGRYANRIAGGKFSLDGKAYQLPVNDNDVNSLHGGGKGFDKQVWKVVSIKSGPTAKAVLALTSPDGDAGYPGKLDVTVTYTLDENGNLGIAFDAKTDKPTIVNMTNPTPGTAAVPMDANVAVTTTVR